MWCPDLESYTATYFGETVKNKLKTKLYEEYRVFVWLRGENRDGEAGSDR